MNTLAYNICASTMNHIDYTFISPIEVLQAQKEASQLFPADYMLAKVDKLVRKHSAFESMADLLSARCYRPTLYCNAASSADTRKALRLIADYYDTCMEQMGDSRRAYRV